MRVILRVTAGPDEGKCIWLREAQELKFGRAQQADHAFPHDSQMSGLHFGVACDGKKCRLTDLRSTNGTFVNGQQCGEKELAHGDEVLAGRTRFRVEIDDRPRSEIRVPSAVMRQARPQVAQAAAANAAALDLSGNAGEPRQRPVVHWLHTCLPDSARAYAEALVDADLDVRREAALAAAWTREPWLLELCRIAAKEGSVEDWVLHYLLAVLGKPVDLQRLLALTRLVTLGPRRWELLGAYGHPEVVEELLAAMGGRDPLAAGAAARAFTRITGVAIQVGPLVDVPWWSGAAGPPDIEPGEVHLPDLQAARREWRRLRPQMGDVTRLCHGLPMHQRLDERGWSLLSLASHWEVCLREHYEGGWRWSPDRVARFPDLRAAPDREL